MGRERERYSKLGVMKREKETVLCIRVSAKKENDLRKKLKLKLKLIKYIHVYNIYQMNVIREK